MTNITQSKSDEIVQISDFLDQIFKINTINFTFFAYLYKNYPWWLSTSVPASGVGDHGFESRLNLGSD